MKAVIVAPVLWLLAWRARRSALAFQVLGLGIALAPWMIRNGLVLGTWNPMTSNAVMNAWIGHNGSNLTGGFMEPPDLPPNGRGMLDAAMRFFVTQPEASSSLLGRKVIRLLEPVYLYFDSPISTQVPLHWVTIVLNGAVIAGFVLYLAGRVWLPTRMLPDVGPLVAFVLLFYLVHLPFIAEARVMTPVLPVTITVAVATAFSWVQRLRGRRRSKIPTDAQAKALVQSSLTRRAEDDPGVLGQESLRGI